MGLFPHKNCHLYKENARVVYVTPPMPAPDPARFRIVRTEEVGTAIVAEIHYPDCTNYEGYKIMLFEKCNSNELKRRKTLDPHFSPKSGPIARFEPTKRGWELALEAAKIIG